QSFWVAIPECYNQTAQLDSFTTFNFTGGTKIQTSNLGSGGDPNALHGCVAEIASYTGNGHNVGDLIAVIDVGGPQAGSAFPNTSQQGPNPGFTAGDCTVTTPSDHSAILNVCGATFLDVCVAPYGIVQGPPPQVLLGCGVATQSVPGGDSSGGTQNAY